MRSQASHTSCEALVFENKTRSGSSYAQLRRVLKSKILKSILLAKTSWFYVIGFWDTKLRKQAAYTFFVISLQKSTHRITFALSF